MTLPVGDELSAVVSVIDVDTAELGSARLGGLTANLAFSDSWSRLPQATSS